MIRTLCFLKPFENQRKLLMKEGSAKEHKHQVGHRGKSSVFKDGHACQMSPMSYVFLMKMQNSLRQSGTKLICPSYLQVTYFCNKRNYAWTRANIFRKQSNPFSRHVCVFCFLIFSM